MPKPIKSTSRSEDYVQENNSNGTLSESQKQPIQESQKSTFYEFLDGALGDLRDALLSERVRARLSDPRPDGSSAKYSLAEASTQTAIISLSARDLDLLPDCDAVIEMAPLLVADESPLASKAQKGVVEGVVGDCQIVAGTASIRSVASEDSNAGNGLISAMNIQTGSTAEACQAVKESHVAWRRTASSLASARQNGSPSDEDPDHAKMLQWKEALTDKLMKTNKDVAKDHGKSMLILNNDTATRAKIHLTAVVRQKTASSLGRCHDVAIHSVTTVLSHPLVFIDSAMAGVIVLNAIVIGASADSADWDGWIVVDAFFCFFFILEFVLKVHFLGWLGYFCKEIGWHWFEIILLVSSLMEVAFALAARGKDIVSGSSLFRVFRLLRLTKLLRICKLRFVNDLVMMVNGAIGGLRTLFWSVIIISLPLYVVALVMRETLGANEKGEGHGAECFSTLARAFFTMFVCVVAGDCSDEHGRPIFVLASAKYGWAYGMIYLLTLLFMIFGLFNVIIAIYVENTVAAAKCNEMKIKEIRLHDERMFKEKALEMALIIHSFKEGVAVGEMESESLDLDNLYSIEITHDEFLEICNDRAFCDVLSELDISHADQKDLFDTLDVDRGGTLDLTELIGGIAKLRGDAKKSDVVGVILSVRHVTLVLDQMSRILDNHSEALHFVQEAVVGLSQAQTKHHKTLNSIHTKQLDHIASGK
jgi:hypothetical protein